MTQTKIAWTVDLDAIYYPHHHPLEVGRLLGIPRLETLRLAVAISDAVLGLCGVVPSLLSDLHAHAEHMYSEVVNKLIDEYLKEDDYPDDILYHIPTQRERYRKEVLNLAMVLVGHAPPDTREIIYVCHLHGRQVLLRLTQDGWNERIASVRSQISQSVQQRQRPLDSAGEC